MKESFPCLAFFVFHTKTAKHATSGFRYAKPCLCSLYKVKTAKKASRTRNMEVSLDMIVSGKVNKVSFLSSFISSFDVQCRNYRNGIRSLLARTLSCGTHCFFCPSPIMMRCGPYGPYARCCNKS